MPTARGIRRKVASVRSERSQAKGRRSANGVAKRRDRGERMVITQWKGNRRFDMCRRARAYVVIILFIRALTRNLYVCARKGEGRERERGARRVRDGARRGRV